MGRALTPAVQTGWCDGGHPQQEESITAEGFSSCREAGAGSVFDGSALKLSVTVYSVAGQPVKIKQNWANKELEDISA